MSEIKMSIHIERPIEEVFLAFTDARSQPQWDPDLLEGRHEPNGPAQLGTKVTEVRKFGACFRKYIRVNRVRSK